MIDSYIDDAIGIMAIDSDGKMSMTQVTLKPHVQFSGSKKPTIEQLEKMHHQSHEQCFIANSVKTEIIVENDHLTLKSMRNVNAVTCTAQCFEALY